MRTGWGTTTTFFGSFCYSFTVNKGYFGVVDDANEKNLETGSRRTPGFDFKSDSLSNYEPQVHRVLRRSVEEETKPDLKHHKREDLPTMDTANYSAIVKEFSHCMRIEQPALLEPLRT